jgi:hypothetical protein
MKNRKSTPDIMSNLMLNQASLISGEQESLQVVDIKSNKAVIEKAFGGDISSNHKVVQPDSNKAVKTVMPLPIKEKTTFNLSQEILIELEDAWIKLRRKLKGEQRITKTLIVEKAIKIILADFESKSELSDIFQELKS